MSAPGPDPWTELRPLALGVLSGPSYWALRPLARLELAVGAYEDIGTHEVPGIVGALVDALPPLAGHACSVGRPGGFVERLVRGTYAPHVVEHVALALQESAGHDVGFGRARGAGAPGTYVVVCAFGHAVVGVRALALALDLVRRAFAGVLRPDDAAAATDALRVLGTTPDPRAPLRALVPCAVSGGDAAGRATVVRALRTLARDADRDAPAVVEVAPSLGLTAGLPYRRARVAVVLDGEPGDDVAAFYREPDRALRLATLVLDTLADDGVAVVPDDAPALVAHAREAVGAAGAERVRTFTVPAEIPSLVRDVLAPALVPAPTADAR